MAVTTAGVIATAAAASSAVGVASAVSGYRTAQSQGEKAEQQEREATAERIRRLGIEREAILGAQVAGAAAGGVDVASASVRSLQAETISEFERQIAFTKRAGAFAAEAIKGQARSVAYQNLTSGLSSLVNAVRFGDEAIQAFKIGGEQ